MDNRRPNSYKHNSQQLILSIILGWGYYKGIYQQELSLQKVTGDFFILIAESASKSG